MEGETVWPKERERKLEKGIYIASRGNSVGNDNGKSECDYAASCCHDSQ